MSEKKTRKQKRRKTTLYVTRAGIIACLYLVLTVFSFLFQLSSGPVQFRFSEVLCILPVFTDAAIPGLAVGCLLSNFVTGGAVADAVFGTLSTLLAAVLTRLLRKTGRILPLVPPIVCNAAVVPFVILYCYGASLPYWMVLLGVAAGEIVTAGIGGFTLELLLEKNRRLFEN